MKQNLNRYNEINPLPPYVLRPSSISRSMKARDKEKIENEILPIMDDINLVIEKLKFLVISILVLY